MTKSILSLFIMTMCVLFLFACISIPRVPDWYLNPPTAEDAVYGTGEAKMASDNMSKTTADSRARSDVASQVEVTVKNALTDYAQQAGQGRNQQVIEFVEMISRQVSEVTLKGAKVIRREIGPDGTYYSLVEYPISAINDAAMDSFMRNEAAAYAEFKANEALDYLNAELEEK